VAGYSVSSWNALAAPAGTPRAVLDALNGAVRVALDSPQVKERLGRSGVRLQAGSPEQMSALLVSEISRWGSVIRAARIQPS
jgi:tripartite-type tricarboxylate transporter receptor subunit TctC